MGFYDALRVELRHAGSGVRVAIVQLPGINTPQFGWVRTRLRRHPQPVPPIYQPEIAARAILWAAKHPRRELWVGLPTVRTILAGAIAPGIVDRYLARTGYEAQMTRQAIDPRVREDNLDRPPPEDPGAHGVFDDHARRTSIHAWATTHRPALIAILAGLAAAGTAMRAR